MSNKDKLLKLREKMHKKQPEFKRTECWRLKRIKRSWRRPRGLDNQTRNKEKGVIPEPEVGYRTPKKVRGLHPTGYKQILINNINDLQKLNPKLHIAVISRTVGKLKRTQIISEADELNILVANPGRLHPKEKKVPIPTIPKIEDQTLEEKEKKDEG